MELQQQAGAATHSQVVDTGIAKHITKALQTQSCPISGLSLQVRRVQPRGKGPHSVVVQGGMHAMARGGYDAGITHVS